MKRALSIVIALLLGSCWAEESQLCHLQPSQKSICTCKRTCEGTTTTWTASGCAADEKAPKANQCPKSCTPDATCTECSCKLLEESCVATVCGT